MTTNTQVTTRSQVDVGCETSQFALGVGVTVAAMIGIWAVVCMASTLLDNGLGGVMRGLVGAIVGS
ncbi:MAG: hypothetical protein KKD01_15610 [Proteobacteria bacterium]|nr:hypothetical protein [Pseudomonadota bacterium]MBU1139508.1 hypothetical protein [Pseudomonadota bacterium]MBU1231654.1 hypothetical protein [Pseudomonadota bacterium]MBU1417664.1 hypothetical protein [Pseudomonadota bacterium]MBU1456151.1 hypothetical protein [Pseudomonadota bacterium]